MDPQLFLNIKALTVLYDRDLTVLQRMLRQGRMAGPDVLVLPWRLDQDKPEPGPDRQRELVPAQGWTLKHAVTFGQWIGWLDEGGSTTGVSMVGRPRKDAQDMPAKFKRIPVRLEGATPMASRLTIQPSGLYLRRKRGSFVQPDALLVSDPALLQSPAAPVRDLEVTGPAKRTGAVPGWSVERVERFARPEGIWLG